jgi:rRNA maturation endonuclease Nob1
VIFVLALAALAAGFYAGWRLRGSVEASRAHQAIELAGCSACRTIYVGVEHRRCPECGSALHVQHVLTGDCLTTQD